MRAAGALLAATVVGVGSLGTYAFWTDEATLASGTITSGTLDLSVNGATATTFTWTTLTMSDMAPGESKAAAVTLQNTGTTPFTLSATGRLSGAATLTVLTFTPTLGGSPTTDTVYPKQEACTGGTAGSPVVLTGTDQAFLPTTAVVPPGESRTLCVVALLPANADNSAQGKTTTATFTVSAVQAQ